MKTLKFFLFSSFAALIIIAACKADAHRDLRSPSNQTSNSVSGNGINQRVQSLAGTNTSQGTCNPNAYNIVLESKTLVDGNWEWVWSVQNPNPGNGSGGTVQNLSHWGMQFGPCDVMSSAIGAAYSPDGVNWTNFTPAYEVDPSQGCVTSPVFKFDFGTTGNAKSYYKLVLNQDFDQGSSYGYYKSGVKTGCCTFTFLGILCPRDR